MPSKVKRSRIDWCHARRLYEQDGLTLTEIGRRLGCRRDTVGIHARRESWVNPAEIRRATGAERREKIFRKFVERDTETVLANLVRKHVATTALLDLTLRELHRLERDELRHGEDPVHSLRRLALVLQTLEVVDRALAGLDRGGWTPGSGVPQDQGDHEERVRRALDHIEERGAGSP